VKSRVPEPAPSSPPAPDDVKAVNDLIRAHEEWAKEYARRLSARKPLVERLGEEAEGEAIYALWEAAQVYDPAKGSFKQLAATIIRRRLIDAARELAGLGSRGPLGGLRRVEPRDTGEDDDSPTPSGPLDRAAIRAWRQEQEAAEQAEQVEVVSQALEQLPPRYRDVMYALYFEGKSIESLARKYDVHPSWIRAIRRRAIVKLREILGEGAERGPFAQETDDASPYPAVA
jgi:RNA polymerase sigma factor (sigma-70 family)